MKTKQTGTGRLKFAVIFGTAMALAALCACNNTKTEQKEATPEAIEAPAPATEQAHFDIKNTGGKITVLDFSAIWCQPCRNFKPIFEKASEKYADVADFTTIDVDENSDLAAQFRIEAVPTIVILDAEGNLLQRTTGAPDEATFDEMIRHLTETPAK